MKLSRYVGETRDLERSLEAIVDTERRGLLSGGCERSDWRRSALPVAVGLCEKTTTNEGGPR
jgi:hypothetical protein